MALQAQKSPYAERQQFIDMVRRHETEAKESPDRYQARCRRTVRIGYLYLGFILTILLGILGGLVYAAVASESISAGLIKLILIVGIPVLAIIASLFRRLPDEKDGIDVSRREAPRLWSEVEALQRALKAPPIHVIRITADWNASASQIPLFGLFGPCRNTLRYGLPLLAAETVDETRATIAHELGHFAGDHSRFSGSVYRVFETWQVAGHHLGGVSSILLKPFLNWYLPRLWATTFPLRRQSEYAADEAATRLCGGRTNAKGLVRMGTQSAKIGDTYKEVYDLVETQAAPPGDLVTQLVRAAKTGMSEVQFDESLGKSLAEKTDYDDSHPSLSDRLGAISAEVDPCEFREEICGPTSPSAADALLGEALALKLEQGLNQHWFVSVQPGWEMRHRQVAAGAAVLRSVNEGELATMPLPTLSKHLSTSLEVRGAAASESIARAVLERDPHHGEACLVMAAKFFETDHAEARQYLETASRDPQFRAAAYSGLSALAEKEGNKIEAAKYYDLAEKEGQSEAAFYNEITTFNEKNSLSVWHPEPHQLQTTVAVLQGVKHAAAAYAVSFPSTVRPGASHQVIAIILKYPTFVSDEEALIRTVMESLQGMTVAYRVVIPKEKALRRAITETPGALIWGTPP